MHWIVVTIKPNQSMKAESNLIAQDIQCFFPKIDLRKNKKKITKNLFPGYGFVQITAWNQLQSVSATKGVSKIVTFNSKIPTLSSAIVSSIQEKLGALSTNTNKKMIQKDDNVIINVKLFEGMQAKVIDIIKRKESQVLLLQILDRPQTIWFNLKDVSPDRDLISDYSSL